jgi:alpha-ribazole phosphatase/probable phosphoglycerate mutase
MKKVRITYFVHGTTTDNQEGLATGWAPGELSKLGRRQCLELIDKIKAQRMKFDVVFCSDLKRAVDSAEITHRKDNVPIIQDKRLRECNYGDLTRTKSKDIESNIYHYINNSFPNGESYKDVENRIRSFCKDLLKKYSGKSVAIVAHRAPQLALDVIIKGKSWKRAFDEDWRHKKAWKPGWVYLLDETKV